MGEKSLEFQSCVRNGRFDLNAYITFLFQQAEVGAALDERVKEGNLSR